MRITLDDGPFFTFRIRSDSGRSRLVQFDIDFPGVARTFGWGGRAETVPPDIWEAYEFLDNHVGSTAEDPGYF